MPTNGVLLLNLGSLAVGATNQVTIGVQPNATGLLTNLFTVFSDETDPAPGNNSATVVSTVQNSTLTNVVLYTVVDLGDLGASNSEAYAINNPGQIVGNATIPGGNGHAVSWTNILTPPINIGDTNVNNYSKAASINNSGQIVGNFNEPTFNSHAAFWTNSASPPFDLGTLGGTFSEALGINNAGQIVGDATTATPLDHACFWVNSSSPPMDLGTLGGNTSFALGINAAGQIAGRAMDAGGNTHASFWTNSSSPALELDDAASTNSTATSINDLGQMVGYSREEGGLFWFDQASSPLSLGTIPGYGYISEPACINHSGQIVGATEITNNIKTYIPLTATIWMSQTNPAQDLNYLIATNSGWVLLEAYGINDSGVIVGAGAVTNAGAAHGYVLHAFALIPVNPPSVSADLSLSVSIAPPYLQFYSNVVFTLTVSNAGPSTATGVVVSNQIPTKDGLPSLNFISASDGSTPTNGILLMNLGSLAAGATDSIQITGQITTNLYTGNNNGEYSIWFTNVFQVFADQTDPVPTNNTDTVVSQWLDGTTVYTTSTRTIETNLTANVSQQVTNYSTRLIAVMPGGTVLYDQTFNAAFLDATVQAAVTLAAGDLTGAGAASYTGPTQTNFSQTLAGSTAVTVTNVIGSDVSFATTMYLGPQTIMVSSNQSEPFFVVAGQFDFDTLITTVLTNLVATTNTSTYLNSSVYVMTGIVTNTVLYNVFDLGTLSGTNSQAMAINNPGQIVGEATLLGGAYHAAFWTNVLTPPVNLGDTNVTLASDAYGVNHSGGIAGVFSGAAFTRHAAFWTNSLGPPVDLGTLESGLLSVAYSVNDSGQMVGYSTVNDSGSEELGCFWTNSASPGVGLATLGGNNSFAMSINDSGHIVGDANTGSADHAAYWTDSGSPPVDLGTLGTGPNSAANSINNAGEIVGDSDLFGTTSISHAAFWTNYLGPPIDLGVLPNGASSTASCINNLGQIVGDCSITNNLGLPIAATLWSSPGSPATNLNTVIPSDAGWLLVNASGINDSGDIVGTGIVSNSVHGFQLHAFALIPINQSTNATGADLSLSASDVTGYDLTGSNLFYSITVSNAGPATATGVVISNQIPANVLFVSATGGAVPANGVLLLNLGTLAVGATDAVQVVVQPATAGKVTNLFQVYSDLPDSVLTNNSATVVSTVTNAPVTGVGYPGTPIAWVNPGGAVVVTYSDVSDLGPIQVGSGYTNPATNCQAGDIVLLFDPNGGDDPTNWAAVARFFNPADPTGINNLPATMSQAFFSTNYGGSGFAGFQSFPDTAFFAFNPSITNGVTFSSSTYLQFGPVGGIPAGQENINILAVGLPFSDLSLSASPSPEPVSAGNNLVYSLTVSNAITSVSVFGTTVFSNSLTASGVVISNRIPAGVNFVSATAGATPTNGVLLINLGALGPGATDAVQVVVQPTTAGTLTNLFQVFANEADPAPANNSATVVNTVTNAPVVYPSLPGTPIAWVNPGGSLITTYAYVSGLGPIQVGGGNAGSAYFPATNCQAGDLVFLSDLTGGNDPTNWGAVARFFNPADPTGTNNLPATMSQVFFSTNYGGSGFAGFQLFPVSAFTTDGGFVTTNGVTTGDTSFVQFGPAGAILADQEDIYVAQVVTPNTDLSLSASAAPEPVAAGNNLFYSLTVSNAPSTRIGTSVWSNEWTATGVVISNRIPAGVNFVSATGGATPTNGVLLINLGSLGPGATDAVQVIVQPTTAGKVTNLFQVFADQADPAPANNSATVVSTVTNAASTGTTYTTSVVNYDTILSSNVNQQVTNYSTELIAVMPNGTVVYSNAFAIPFSPGALQAAIMQAAVDLTNAGAASYTGPTETNSSQSLAGTSSVMITNGIGTNVSAVTTAYIGPQTILTGQLGTYQRTNTNASYTGPTGGNPQTFIIAPGGVDYDTLVTTVLTNLVVTTIADTNLNSAVYLMNGIVAQVDVALSLTAAPNPVGVGAPLTYSLTITNSSSTTATGVVVTNTLPPNVTLFSLLPSEGSASNHAGVVTYNVGSLPNGIADTLAIVVIPEAAGLLTNIAVAFSAQTDSQPANNSVTNVTTAVTVPITNLVLTILSPITLNPQTGLFEQQVEVSNGGPSTPSSVLVLVSGLAANATLYNATGKTNGVPFVQSAAPLGVSSNVIFLLEFYVPTRVPPANLTYTVVAGPPFIPPVANGTVMSIDRMTVLPDGSVLVEFSAVPGQVYAIQYSSDMVTWRTAVPAITAPANRVQWIDAGPPKTDSNPAQQPARYYRLVLLQAK